MFIPVENSELPIIIVNNFLPSRYLGEMFSQIVSLRPHFSKSNWTSGLQEQHGPNCSGEDIWLPFSEENDDKNNLVGQELADLWRFLFQEGLTNFLDNSNHIEFRKYSKEKHNFAYHIINYEDGGYYNWHLDSKVSGRTWWGLNVDKPTLYTFSLTLIKDPSLLSGGKQLFMKDGKIVELESKNNQLVIFPSSVFHSLTEIKCDKDLDWEKRSFNIQAWLCELSQ